MVLEQLDLQAVAVEEGDVNATAEIVVSKGNLVCFMKQI